MRFSIGKSTQFARNQHIMEVAIDATDVQCHSCKCEFGHRLYNLIIMFYCYFEIENTFATT